MSTTNRSALAVTSDQPFWSAEQLAALAQIGVQNAPPADLAVFLNFAQRTGLDPFARQLYMIGRNSQGGKKWTIQASIDGLRIVAERSGDYAGQVGPEFCGTDGIWRDVWVGEQPPVAARVGVLRHGFAAPLYAVAYWDEYVQTSANGQPTAMWASKPKLMLAKCAEALALRKAFPNDLAGLYTADEMGNQDRPTVPAMIEAEPAIVVDASTGEVVDAAQGAAGQATDAQLRAIAAMLRKIGKTERDERHAYIANIIARDIDDSHSLTKQEAHQVIDQLKPLCDLVDEAAAEQTNG